MYALYVLLGGLVLTLPAVVGTIVFWGTPMLAPVLTALCFAYTPFVTAAIFHRQLREMLSDGGH